MIREENEDVKLEVFYDTFRFFKLSQGLEVNKLTKFQANFSKAQDVQTSICFFENLEDLDNEVSCQDLESEEVSGGVIEFLLGEAINYKNATLNYLAVKQNSTSSTSSTSLKDLAFIEGQAQDLLNDGVCIDTNATKVADETCQCKDGFVSSNGGKILGMFDQCVPCSMSDFCFFEGQACTNDMVCDMGNCTNTVCATNVSTYFFMSSFIFLCFMHIICSIIFCRTLYFKFATKKKIC